jgi:hypothetical protein
MIWKLVTGDSKFLEVVIRERERERERGGGGLGKAHCRILFLQFRRKYLSGLVVPDSGFHLLFIVELSLENQ